MMEQEGRHTYWVSEAIVTGKREQPKRNKANMRPGEPGGDAQTEQEAEQKQGRPQVNRNSQDEGEVNGNTANLGRVRNS